VSEINDLVIVGSGPDGYTPAINAPPTMFEPILLFLPVNIVPATAVAIAYRGTRRT
jgi:thioredoxin reductase